MSFERCLDDVGYPIGMFTQRLDGTLHCRSTNEDRAVPMAYRQHALHFERHLMNVIGGLLQQ